MEVLVIVVNTDKQIIKPVDITFKVQLNAEPLCLLLNQTKE